MVKAFRIHLGHKGVPHTKRTAFVDRVEKADRKAAAKRTVIKR